MLRVLCLPIGMSIGAPVYAECAPHLEQFLYCRIEGGQKEVQVCFDGSQASYRFGPVGGAPELALTLWISEGATYLPWQGVGREIAETIEFSTNGFTYSAYGGFDRMTAADDTIESHFGGVRVFQGAKLLADLSCIPHTVEWGY